MTARTTWAMGGGIASCVYWMVDCLAAMWPRRRTHPDTMLSGFEHEPAWLAAFGPGRDTTTLQLAGTTSAEGTMSPNARGWAAVRCGPQPHLPRAAASPLDPAALAIAFCHDALVYVFALPATSASANAVDAAPTTGTDAHPNTAGVTPRKPSRRSPLPALSDCVQVLRGHTGDVFAVQYSPTDPNLLVSGSADPEVRGWSLAGGTCVFVLDSHENTVWDLAFVPRANGTGSLLLSGGLDGAMRLWEVPGGRCVGRAQVGGEAFLTAAAAVVAAGPGGRLAAFGFGSRVTLLDVRADLRGVGPDAPLSSVAVLADYARPVASVCFASVPARPRSLVLASTDKEIVLIHGLDWFEEPTPKHSCGAGGSSEATLSMSPSAGSSPVALRVEVRCLRVLTDEPPIRHLAFSPLNPRMLAGAAVDGTVRLWSLDFAGGSDSGTLLDMFPPHHVHQSPPTRPAEASSHDNARAAPPPPKGTLEPIAAKGTLSVRRRLVALDGESVFSVAFSPLTGALVSGAADQRVRWRRGLGLHTWSVQNHRHQPVALRRVAATVITVAHRWAGDRGQLVVPAEVWELVLSHLQAWDVTEPAELAAPAQRSATL